MDVILCDRLTRVRSNRLARDLLFAVLMHPVHSEGSLVDDGASCRCPSARMLNTWRYLCERKTGQCHLLLPWNTREFERMLGVGDWKGSEGYSRCPCSDRVRAMTVLVWFPWRSRWPGTVGSLQSTSVAWIILRHYLTDLAGNVWVCSSSHPLGTCSRFGVGCTVAERDPRTDHTLASEENLDSGRDIGRPVLVLCLDWWSDRSRATVSPRNASWWNSLLSIWTVEWSRSSLDGWRITSTTDTLFDICPNEWSTSHSWLRVNDGSIPVASHVVEWHRSIDWLEHGDHFSTRRGSCRVHLGREREEMIRDRRWGSVVLPIRYDISWLSSLSW